MARGWKTEQVKVDPEPTLKDTPMLTADEHEIKLNSILYRTSYKSGSYFRAECEPKIEVLRVFYVNNTHRTFRTRCAKGCEEIFKVGDGCSLRRLYGSLQGAKDDLKSQMTEDIEKCSSKNQKVMKTWGKIKDETVKLNQLKAADLKLPKEVKL